MGLVLVKNVLPGGWGMTGEGVFGDARVVAWRVLGERDNAVFEFGGKRFHVKRHFGGGGKPAREEVEGWELLRGAGIGTVEMVAWGELPDGRSFTVTEELEGYVSGQVWMRRGGKFGEILWPTARVAAKLHAAGLCHRDLYLCHLFVGGQGEGNEAIRDGGRSGNSRQGRLGSEGGMGGEERNAGTEARGRSDDRPRHEGTEGGMGAAKLIDVGRVRRLGVWPLSRRWVVKDLGQFVYSMGEFGLGEGEVREWLGAYREAGGVWGVGMEGAVRRKVGWIARHDAKLRLREPGRGVSIGEMERRE